MPIHKLAPRKITTAGRGKYEDGGGLRLVVAGSGAKKWVLRFTIDGKRREMGLGSFPDVGLAEARDQAAAYRKQAKAGVDPIEARQTGIETTPTFTTCAARYIQTHRRAWKNANTPGSGCARSRPTPGRWWALSGWIPSPRRMF